MIICINCGAKSAFKDSKISAPVGFHHILPRLHGQVGVLKRKGKIKEAYQEMTRCIPLCASCHAKVHYWPNLEGKIIKKMMTAIPNIVTYHK